jgi:hypothetical protein
MKILLINYIFFITILMEISFSQASKEITVYSLRNNLKNIYPSINLPLIDKEKLLNQDANKAPGSPQRYGFKHHLSYSINNSGIWTEMSDGGKLWQLEIRSLGAYAMSVEYENFYIPEGGELYIYNQDYEMAYGAYTSLNNSIEGYFSTPLIKGDIVIIEYYQPKETYDTASFTITKIIHDYRDIMNFYNIDNRDWECGINVICEDSPFYQNPINSVAFLDMGGFICSGSMINNVRQDLTPYFLTAWHCIEGSNPSNFRFYFNKEASSCDQNWASSGSYAYGSNLVADSDGIPGGDFALLLITDEIEEDWNVFYAGWDATENYPLISCGIHHPGGTGKKINYDNDLAYGAYWDTPSDGLTHWQVNFDTGGTEGGSSGSPIFNDRYRIVGVLTGGSGGCGDPYPSLYGKFHLGWNFEMPENRRLIDWLDPDFSGTLVIDGIYEIEDSLSGDLNADDEVNILDIISLANLILANDFVNIADLNFDGTLNILDIIVMANIILENT